MTEYVTEGACRFRGRKLRGRPGLGCMLGHELDGDAARARAKELAAIGAKQHDVGAVGQVCATGTDGCVATVFEPSRASARWR